jgi:hypothetical protein
MELEIGKFFLQVANDFIGHIATFKKMKFEKRERLAEHIKNIANCLKAIADSFQEKRVPFEKCGELDEYVASLPSVCKGIVPPEDIERFQNVLQKRAHARAMMSIFSDESATQNEVNQLASASGQLKAFANALIV